MEKQKPCEYCKRTAPGNYLWRYVLRGAIQNICSRCKRVFESAGKGHRATKEDEKADIARMLRG